ncbi:MAG: malectin domain-containing carbohydrate-binding protein, partial [Capsulimonadaceae bacterium]
SLLAAEGGNIYRPGHATSSEEFVNAADQYGVFIDQPSGDNEEAFAAAGDPSADMITIKEEFQRDMIVRDRSHPSILDWESNNGTMEESVGTPLLAINSEWDPINTRVAADRTPDNVNGYLLGCTLEGCEVGVKETTDSALGQNLTNNPAWGAEYWGTGTARGLAWNFELAFIAPFLDNWQKSKAADCMGMAQWYMADTPGETGQYVEAGSSTTAPGNSNAVRSLGASSMDQNRFPKLLYYAYEAAWTPFSIKPVVRLAGHWNQSGTVQVNAFSNCPAVKLLLNGVQQGSTETPNPWDSNDESNQTQTATGIPFQAYWSVPWASGTITAECLNQAGQVVATDSRTTAGAENKIVLTVTPELIRPDGTNYQIKANGSDAAIVTAEIEDANGNWEPLASDTLTFSVSGPATYQGGTQQYVSTNTDTYSNANSTYVNGVPDAFYMAPGDPQLAVEGGLTRVALRSQFTAGTVTVTATAPGLTSGTATFNIVAVPDPRNAPTSVCTAVAAAPTGLAATAVASNVISLTWNAVTPPASCVINEYNVFRSTTSGFTPSTSNLIAPNVENNSYDDTSPALAGTTTYYYVVEAVDSYGASAASAQASVLTPAGNIPPIPTGLAASYGNGRVSLSWTASTGATSYNVYRGTASGGESATAFASGVTSPTYIDTAVVNGTTYYYEVAAVNANGTSSKSYEVNATPSSAADVIAVNCGGGATGNWLADTDYNGGAADVVTNTISTAGVSNPAPVAVYQSNRYGNFTYTIGSLTASTSYTVRLHFCETYFDAAGDRTFDVSINGTQVLTNFDIFATAGAENQAVVEQFTETTNSSGQFVIAITTVVNNGQLNGIEVLGSSGTCDSVPPTGPSTLTATTASSSSINLSWATGFANPPCTVTSYDVFRSTTNGFTPSSANLDVNVTSTTYTDTGLAASTTYYYVVETLDSYGASSASEQASAETSASGGGAPGAPGNLSASAGNAQIALSWTAGSGATSYNVYRGTASGGESATAITTGVTTTSYTNTGLTNGTAYYYKVASVNASGTSAQSNEASATPSASTGGMVLGINSGGAATGSWVADEDYNGGTADVVTNTISTTGVTNPAPIAVYQSNRYGTFTYTVTGLTASTSYTVRLHFC